MQGVINCPPSSAPSTKDPIGNKEGLVEEGGLLRPSPSSHKSYQGASFGPNALVKESFTQSGLLRRACPRYVGEELQYLGMHSQLSTFLKV